MLRGMRESLVPKLPVSQHAELRTRLAKALESENYELAAILRDELKMMGKTATPIPATGKTETVVNDIRFSARNRGRTLAIDDVSGRLANLTFAARGALTLPADLDAPQSSSSSQAEVDACVKVAMVDTTKETDPKRRWAYTCASVLTSAGFMTY